MKSVSEWPAASVEMRPISALVPYAKNSRTHSPAQVDQIVASMREWGWTNPVLVDEDGMIIAGHGRILAAQKLGMTDAPVMTARNWTASQKQAYVIADNKLALNAGWDMDKLAVEIGDLQGAGYDIGLVGFTGDELLALAGGTQGQTDPDEVPEPKSVSLTKSGEIWVCGDHLVMCGDSRSPDDVGRLLGGRKINMGFTSPPYAEQRLYDAASGFKPIHPDEYVGWFAPVAANVAENITDDGSWFVNIKPSSDGLDTSLYVMDLVISHVREWGWHFATEFCWERNGVPKSVTQRFKNQFEPIYQFARGRWKMRPDAVRHESQSVPRAGGKGVGNTSWANKQGGNGAMFGGAKKRRNGTSEFMSEVQGVSHDVGNYIGPGLAYPGNRLPTFTESHKATGHTAAFPVGLPEFFCKAYTDEGDIVFDPFCGSGSTMIASEKTGRKCVTIDISPIYVDVAIRRWQLFTGKSATLQATGQTFEEVTNARAQAAA